MPGKPTITTYRTLKALRECISPSLAHVGTELKTGKSLPLDKQTLWIELALIECYFPDKQMVRATLRDSLLTNHPQSVYAYVVVNEYDSVINKGWIPRDCGEPVKDPETGWMKVVPEGEYMGIVEPLKGDHRNPYILKGYVHMPDEEDLTKRTNQIIWDSEPPTDGVWQQGDICLDNSSQELLGWICDEGGRPGTWNSILKIMIDTLYPVGCMIHSSNINDPRTKIPGTVWERIKGKFLLGADDELYIAGETGGEATHTLTTNEMPSHGHNVRVVAVSNTGIVNTQDTVAYTSSGGGGTTGGPSTNSTDSQSPSTNSAGSHSHTIKFTLNIAGTGSISAYKPGGDQSGSSESDGSHSHTVNSHSHSLNSHTHTTPDHSHTVNAHNHAIPDHSHTVLLSQEARGGGQAHNNMPPYLAVFIWKRTA